MNTTVIASITISVGVVYINTFSDPKKHATIRPLVGGFIGAIALTAVGSWSDQVANSFAALILVTALLVNGAEIFGTVTNATKSTPQTTTRTGPK